jgi:hypothetical protein
MSNTVFIDGPLEQEGYNLIGEWLDSVVFDEKPTEEFPELELEDDDEPEDS